MLKTYDIFKLIDNNKNMLGKRFKMVGGLEGDYKKIGDIAIVVEYFGLISLGSEKYDNVRIDLNGFEEWEEI